jgi:serine/threonine-protein kinase
MAQLFLATLDGPDGFSKLCVLKRILPELAQDPSFAAMFVNEAKVAAMLSHPNIVQIFEFAKEEDQYFLAMEYVEGTSLDRLMKAARKATQPLGPRVAVEIGIPVANALAYAHDFTLPDGSPLSLVHRDIAPDNILVSREGIVKLTDFGVVKTAINAHGTVAGVVKGKWSYMSPEQVLALPVDRRSDVFSLGIVLYELATGVRLFRGDSVPQTANAVARAEVVPPSKIVANFPIALERILLKALAREPAQRYQTTAQLGAYLDAFRVSQSWSQGSQHLGALVTQLCPEDRSGTYPAYALSAESSSARRLATRSTSPTSQAGAMEVADHDIDIAEATPRDDLVSTPVALALAVGVAVVSLLFWYLVS